MTLFEFKHTYAPVAERFRKWIFEVLAVNLETAAYLGH